MGDGNTFDNKDNTVHNQAGSQVVYGSIYNNTFYTYDQGISFGQASNNYTSTDIQSQMAHGILLRIR